ncbi:hypothetical protein DFH09DRAFT_1211334 [Mycena vulgaris]|nr:hypothetical protein DFH09DRAFT_1211334 [Mycena vulgaris]
MSRGIDRELHRLSPDIAPFRLNEPSTMVRRHIQLFRPINLFNPATTESTPNASGGIFRLVEVAALRKEGGSPQGRPKQRMGGMVSRKRDPAKAAQSVPDLNGQPAPQASVRKKKTKIPREIPMSSELANTHSRDITNGAVKPEPQTHLEQFFARYPLYRYDPSAPVSAQYQAMCRKYGFLRRFTNSWEAKSELELEADAARAGFRLAMVRTFNDLFGTDVDDLKNWQSFCTVLEISPVPTKLRACRAAVRDVHVNLVDLIDWGIARAEIHKFETLDELAAYTRETGKFFPQSEAEAGGMLRFLLRRIA